MFDQEIRTHSEYLDYIDRCFGEAQRTNAYRILSFLKYGNKAAEQMVSSNPHAGLTAYYSVADNDRWAGIITGNDKILLLADRDIIEKYKDKIESEKLTFDFFSLNRGAIIIPTTKEGGMVDEDGNLTLDMGFVTDFAKFCLSSETPPFGELE